PTGSTLGRPPVADEWTESTKPTVKPSKISTCTRWSAMPGNAYAASSSGKQVQRTMTPSGWPLEVDVVVIWTSTHWFVKSSRLVTVTTTPSREILWAEVSRQEASLAQ